MIVMCCQDSLLLCYILCCHFEIDISHQIYEQSKSLGHRERLAGKVTTWNVQPLVEAATILLLHLLSIGGGAAPVPGFLVAVVILSSHLPSCLRDIFW